MSNVDDFEIQDGVLIKYNGKRKENKTSIKS